MTPTPKKLPKAKTGFVKPEELAEWDASAGTLFIQTRQLQGTHHVPVAVIPCPTQRQARALVRWANLSREEKVGRLSVTIFNCDYPTEKISGRTTSATAILVRDKARAILDAMEGK